MDAKMTELERLWKGPEKLVRLDVSEIYCSCWSIRIITIKQSPGRTPTWTQVWEAALTCLIESNCHIALRTERHKDLCTAGNSANIQNRIRYNEDDEMLIVIVNTKSTQNNIVNISKKYFKETDTIVYPQTSSLLPMHCLCTTRKALKGKLTLTSMHW